MTLHVGSKVVLMIQFLWMQTKLTRRVIYSQKGFSLHNSFLIIYHKEPSAWYYNSQDARIPPGWVWHLDEDDLFCYDLSVNSKRVIEIVRSFYMNEKTHELDYAFRGQPINLDCLMRKY